MHLNPTPTTRSPTIDALRGLAIALMVAYHFCFDLAYFNYADFNFYQDPFWLHARTFILSLFLALVGVSLVLATETGLRPKRFLRRLLLILAGAALVSLSTWWQFGDRFVFFGVLHFIAVASVVGLVFVRRPWLSLVTGVVLLLVGNLFTSVWFDEPGRRWIGLMTHKPLTEDYVPMLPWMGVVLLGIAGAHGVKRMGWLGGMDAWMGEGRVVRMLVLAGRHSLIIYLVHQPLLFGMLLGWRGVFG